MIPTASNTDKPTVGVVPPSALLNRRRFFSALEQIFDVHFVVAEGVDNSGCDAHVVIGEPLTADTLGMDRIRAIRFATDEPRGNGSVGHVFFQNSAGLDPRLRGRKILERYASCSALEADRGVVLARDSKSRPLWRKMLGEHFAIDEVAVSAPRLEMGEALRDHLTPGRFFSLLVFVHFLREVVREFGSWTPAPLRATIVIDDPNLHWRSYGTLRYKELAAHAAKVGYHIGMATIPLDSWFVYPPAARLFREQAEYLSLTVHGNDHVERELGKDRPEKESIALLAQALRRVERLEASYGVTVSRVMVPPHEACSEQTLRLLPRLGYEAVSMTRPHPWIRLSDQSSSYATSADDLTNGWFPAVMRADGFPVLIRRGIANVDDVVLRAYLDQPLIFYGHIRDFTDGLDPLEAIAREINSLSGVRWCSLGEIAASNFETRKPTGNALLVRPFARRTRIGGLEGVDEIAIVGQPHGVRLRIRCFRADGLEMPAFLHTGTEAVRLSSAVSEVDVTRIPAGAIDHNSVPPPRRNLRAIVRRAFTEARDRIMPDSQRHAVMRSP